MIISALHPVCVCIYIYINRKKRHFSCKHRKQIVEISIVRTERMMQHIYRKKMQQQYVFYLMKVESWRLKMLCMQPKAIELDEYHIISLAIEFLEHYEGTQKACKCWIKRWMVHIKEWAQFKKKMCIVFK